MGHRHRACSDFIGTPMTGRAVARQNPCQMSSHSSPCINKRVVLSPSYSLGLLRQPVGEFSLHLGIFISFKTSAAFPYRQPFRSSESDQSFPLKHLAISNFKFKTNPKLNQVYLLFTKWNQPGRCFDLSLNLNFFILS
jgi:hypothetical protein